MLGQSPQLDHIDHARERRQRRSDDLITALHYQLSHTRGAAGLDAVVLVDDTGCLVAGAGAWPVCEELAVFAPLLADRTGRARVSSASVSERLRELEAEVRVQTVALDGCQGFLCALGAQPPDEDAWQRAADGCRRILMG